MPPCQMCPDFFRKVQKIARNPWISFSYFCFIGVLGLFDLESTSILWVVLPVFAILSLIEPLFGIQTLLLGMPFFLGNSKRAYFWIFEFFMSFICIGISLRLIYQYFYFKTSRDWILPSIFLFFLIYICSLFLSQPIDMGTTIHEIKHASISKSFERFLSSHEGRQIYFLRSFFNHLSVGFLFLYLLMGKLPLKKFQRLIPPAIIIFSTVIFCAFGFRFNWFEHGGKFLTLHFFGFQPIMEGRVGMTSFAYNCGYLAQYIIGVLPFLGYLIYWSRLKKVKVFLLIFLFVASILVLFYTYQRGPQIALVCQLGFLSIYFLLRSKHKIKSLGIITVSSILIMGLFLIVDHFYFSGISVQRLLVMFENPSGRIQIWTVALQMFKENPVFGIGLGNFHDLFPKYCLSAGIPWEGYIRYTRTTAHNTYFHILAEQGLLGLISFGLISFYTIKKFFSPDSINEKYKNLQLSLILSLVGFWSYGISQYIFYVRSIELGFWVILGVLTCSITKKNKKIRIKPMGQILFIFGILALSVIRAFYLKKYGI